MFESGQHKCIMCPHMYDVFCLQTIILSCRHSLSLPTMPATGPPFTPSQLNYFKFNSLVVDEFPKVLRQLFKTMWDNKFPGQPWDDSATVRNEFSVLEARANIPTGNSYMDWDCTALFQATIFANTFKNAAGRTLKEQYVGRPTGEFHSTVTSSTGVQDETFALAIDQLRLLRNKLSHFRSTQDMERPIFDYCILYAKRAFQAVNYSTSYIDYISELPESEFPTTRSVAYKKIIFYCIVALLLFIVVPYVVRVGVPLFFTPSGPSGKAYNVHKKETGLSLINALSAACAKCVN